MANLEMNLDQLFQTIETRFRSAGFDDERWYILAVTTIAASTDPERAAELYQYLVSKPTKTSPESRQELIRRIREALVKSVSIMGVCKPMESIMSISKIERVKDRDYTCTREGWKCDSVSHQRGLDWIKKLYTTSADDMPRLFSAHKDFAWLSTEITYGLYLSDRQVLDDLDTQLVVLPGIMMQNLRSESHWHIRGTRRIGVSKEKVEVIHGCVLLVAGFFDMNLNKVPTVDAVEYDV